jgi:hypothetical protein
MAAEGYARSHHRSLSNTEGGFSTVEFVTNLVAGRVIPLNEVGSASQARRLTLLIPSCAGHRIEHEKKHGPSGQTSDKRNELRFELDGYRRIEESSAMSGHAGDSPCASARSSLRSKDDLRSVAA